LVIPTEDFSPLLVSSRPRTLVPFSLSSRPRTSVPFLCHPDRGLQSPSCCHPDRGLQSPSCCHPDRGLQSERRDLRLAFRKGLLARANSSHFSRVYVLTRDQQRASRTPPHALSLSTCQAKSQ